MVIRGEVVVFGWYFSAEIRLSCGNAVPPHWGCSRGTPPGGYPWLNRFESAFYVFHRLQNILSKRVTGKFLCRIGLRVVQQEKPRWVVGAFLILCIQYTG